MKLDIVILALGAVMTAHGLTDTEKGKFSGITITNEGSNLRLTGSGQPDHVTDNFPTNYNPNSISSQSYSFIIPNSPSKASESTCLPMGPIGFAVNGVPFFSPYTIEGYNAVDGDNAEIFDSCDGHPDRQGAYHYHQLPDCVYDQTENELVGVAMDGYPIYGPKTSDGKILTSSDLDECHGRTVSGIYRYHVTGDFPYVIGCFYGNIVDSGITRGQGRSDCKKAVSVDSGAPKVSKIAPSLFLVNLAMLVF